MIKQPIPSAMRWLTGSALVATLTLITGVTAWAGQPPANAQTEASTNIATDLSESAKSDMTAADLPAPAYPEVAKSQGIDGKVILIVDVTAAGHVKAARVEHSEPSGVFDAAALEAVKKWKFNPGMKDGKAVGGKVRVPITFESKTTGRSKDASAQPAGKDLNLSAYDWVEYDLADNRPAKSTHCDVIRSNIAHAQTGYCGTLKK